MPLSPLGRAVRLAAPLSALAALACGGGARPDDFFGAEAPLAGRTPEAGAPVVPPLPPPPAVMNGATCAPTGKAFRPAAWVPPAALHQGRCTKAQIDALVPCLEEASESPGCKAFLAAPANATCLACAITDDTARARGPLYEDGTNGYVNNAGCVAAVLRDPSPVGCGARYEQLQDCELAQCNHCDDETFEACLTVADQGVCAPYAPSLSCAEAQREACFADSFGAVAAKLVTLFCGLG